MIPSTLKTIFIDGELADSSVLLDVQHPYREKDLLLTNHFDDVDDDVHDQVKRQRLFIITFSTNCFFCQQVPKVMEYTCYVKLRSNFIHKNISLFSFCVLQMQ